LYEARQSGREAALAGLKRRPNQAEEQMWALLKDLPGWQREVPVRIGRKWRFDFAHPKILLALEVEGQVHKIGTRFDSDVDKYNEAMLDGWRVLRVTPEMVRDGRALELVVQALRIFIAGDRSSDLSDLTAS
jgi:very-short-patch-repair endonuclease